MPIDADVDFYKGIVREVQQEHLRHPKWDYADIAYNFAVDPLGNIYECRGWHHQTAAQFGGNRVSLAVVYLGGPTTVFTRVAQRSFEGIGRDAAGPWLPHSHWTSTHCPGSHVGAWLEASRAP